jgi:hypothetical protein
MCRCANAVFLFISWFDYIEEARVALGKRRWSIGPFLRDCSCLAVGVLNHVLITAAMTLSASSLAFPIFLSFTRYAGSLG